jgi:heme/copper-type cytochrome/quinol oxidase subunit 1
VRYVDRLGLAQRIVILIGFGLGLMVLGGYLVSLDGPANFGWFGYAPLTQNSFVPRGSGLATWQLLLIWLGLILVWSVVGVLLLEPRRDSEPETQDRP